MRSGKSCRVALEVQSARERVGKGVVALEFGGVTGEGCVDDGRGSGECSLQKPEGERDSVLERGLGEKAGDVGDNGGRGVACGVVGTCIVAKLHKKYIHYWVRFKSEEKINSKSFGI